MTMTQYRRFSLCFVFCVLLGLFHGAPVLAAAGDFDILEYEVEGNSVLPDMSVETAVYPHLGPRRNFDDVEAARAALEKAYQDAGYLSVAVVIPEQKVVDGIVRLQVMEGEVEKLKVSGNRYVSRSEIRSQVPELAPGQVPHFPSMQAQLTELGRMPDLRATPLLRPGKTPGKLEVELAVEDQLPFHGSIELNSKQSPDTTNRRLEASVRYDNLFQRQHSLSLNYIGSPLATDEVKVISGAYALPLGKGRILTLSAMRSDSNIASAAGSAVVGKGDTYGLRFTLPLPGLAGNAAFFHSLTLGADWKDLKENQNITGGDTRFSPLRYTPFSVQYTVGSLSEEGDLIGNLIWTSAFRGSSSHLVDCHGVTLDQFECRRAGAQGNFSHLRGDLSWTRRTLGWEYMVRGDFQVTGQPLVSNEQFLAGGLDSVRGYLEGEAAGDHGWRLRTEVKTPSLLDADAVSLRGLAFLEASELNLQEPLPGQTSNFHLAGSGLGLRLVAAKNYQLSMDWARALKAGPVTPKGENRLHFRLGATF